MIDHLVLLKFGAATTQDQKDAVIRSLRSLQGKVPGIVDLRCNYNFSERSQGFEIGLTARFETKEALQAYGPHPEHQKVVSHMREVGLTDMIVVDFEI